LQVSLLTGQVRLCYMLWSSYSMKTAEITKRLLNWGYIYRYTPRRYAPVIEKVWNRGPTYKIRPHDIVDHSKNLPICSRFSI